MSEIATGWSAEMDRKADEIIRDPHGYFERARATAEAVGAEAHAEQTRRLARGIFDALADALHIPQFADWVARRITR